MGIHEFLNVTPRLREALMQQREFTELKALAVRDGFRDIRHDGFKKALRGLTTLEEVIEATQAEAA